MISWSSCCYVASGGARFSGSSFRGPYQDLSSQARSVPTKTHQEEAEAKAKDKTTQEKTRLDSTRQDKTGQDKRTQDKTGQGKTGPDPHVKKRIKLEEETFPCLNQTRESSSSSLMLGSFLACSSIFYLL